MDGSANAGSQERKEMGCDVVAYYETCRPGRIESVARLDNMIFGWSSGSRLFAMWTLACTGEYRYR